MTEEPSPQPEQAPPAGPSLAGQPPNDLSAEKSLLARMMLSRDTVADVVEILAGADFYRPAHELIYTAILDLYGNEEPTDPVAVAAKLQQGGHLTRAGGAHYLANLAASGQRGGDPTRLAVRVQSTAMLRRMLEVALHVEQLAATATVDSADDAANAAQAEIFAATRRRPRITAALPLADIYEGTLDEIELLGSRSGHLLGVPTGFTDLDSLTNGLQPGQLVVLASRPAMGKSTLAADWLRSASIAHQIPSLLFTLESSHNEVAMRILAAEARVALHRMRSGLMSDDDWGKVARRMSDVTEAPLYIQDDADLTLTDVRAECRRLHSQDGVRFIVVDGLHMLRFGTRPFASRYEEISEISRCLKQLAKELQVPIVAVSELNRGPEQRTDKKPIISDLRDSGALEDNADLVILLHREDAYEKESPRAGEADLIVAKHRSGPTAVITVAFQGHYSRFVDMAQT